MDSGAGRRKFRCAPHVLRHRVPLESTPSLDRHVHACRRVFPLAAVVLSAGCEPLGPPPGERPPVLFDFPLAGALNEDFYHTNYLDRQPGPGFQDFRCGMKSYDGHRGVDIVLPDFARMDAGITVVAAAAGRVAHVEDGHADRNTSWTQGSGFGNHVVVSHPHGYSSIYAHLKRSSLQVQPGDSVSSGTPLGQVGSSGMSDMPHLHIEFHRNGEVLEPYEGPCGSSLSHWRDPLPYEDGFRVIATGQTRGRLSLGAVKGPPPHVQTLAAGDTATVWVHLHNVRQGTVSRWSLVSPAGEVVSSYARTHETFYSMSWWWVYAAFEEAGEWRIDYDHEGVLRGSHAFLVKQAGAAGAAPLTAAPAAGGTPAAVAPRLIGGGETLRSGGME